MCFVPTHSFVRYKMDLPGRRLQVSELDAVDRYQICCYVQHTHHMKGKDVAISNFGDLHCAKHLSYTNTRAIIYKTTFLRSKSISSYRVFYKKFLKQTLL